MFIPKGDVEVMQVKIYTDDKAPVPGLWNVDNNTVLLTYDNYLHLRACNSQADQKKFFSQLRKVSFSLIV